MLFLCFNVLKCKKNYIKSSYNFIGSFIGSQYCFYKNTKLYLTCDYNSSIIITESEVHKNERFTDDCN